MLSIRRKKVIGGWYQVRDVDVHQGKFYHFNVGWKWRRPIKIEVKSAHGDQYCISYRY